MDLPRDKRGTQAEPPPLVCPRCRAEDPESTCIGVIGYDPAKHTDPNTKTCMACGYAWKQVK